MDYNSPSNYRSIFLNSTDLQMKPTTYEKNNLPEDVRMLYRETIEKWQIICKYEYGTIDKEELIKELRNVTVFKTPETILKVVEMYSVIKNPPYDTERTR